MFHVCPEVVLRARDYATGASIPDTMFFDHRVIAGFTNQ